MKRLIRSLKLALAGKNLSRLQKRFAEVEDFRGLDYEYIVGRVGARADRTQIRDNGQTARTWLEENYSITLLFNGTGIILSLSINTEVTDIVLNIEKLLSNWMRFFE